MRTLEEIAEHYRQPLVAIESMYSQEYDKLKLNYPYMAKEWYNVMAKKYIQSRLRNGDISAS